MKRAYRIIYNGKVESLEATPRKVSMWKAILVRSK